MSLSLHQRGGIGYRRLYAATTPLSPVAAARLFSI
jgi:hypothetical protein